MRKLIERIAALLPLEGWLVVGAVGLITLGAWLSGTDLARQIEEMLR